VKLRLACVCASVLLVGEVVTPEVKAHADSYSVLIASPSGGHSGDTIYIAGSGLQPHHRYPYLLMACPNWAESQYNNGSETAPGPTTDNAGQFKGFPFLVPALHHFKGLGCQIYIKDGGNAYGPSFPGTYTIYPSDANVPGCLKHICIGVNAVPKRVHSGFAETVEVRSKPTVWPGAVVDVRISYPGVSIPRRRLALNFSGVARTQFKVTARTAQPVLARVSARASLGGWGGNGTGSFTIEQ
jgi:hypothetical protein